MANLRSFARWFVIWGGVGVLVAVALYTLGSVPAIRIKSPDVMLILAPAMVLGLAEPTTLGSKLFLLGIVFATNFVLYGLLGLLVCGVWSWFRPSPTTRSC